MQKEQIVSAFDIEGKVIAVEAFGNGHINDTYRVITEGEGTEFIFTLTLSDINDEL